MTDKHSVHSEAVDTAKLRSLQRSLPFGSGTDSYRSSVPRGDEPVDFIRWSEATQILMMNAVISNAGGARDLWKGYAGAMVLAVDCRSQLQKFREEIDLTARQVGEAERDGLDGLPHQWITWDHLGAMSAHLYDARSVAHARYRYLSEQLAERLANVTFEKGPDGEDYSKLAETVAEYCRLDVAVLAKEFLSVEAVVSDIKGRIVKLRSKYSKS